MRKLVIADDDPALRRLVRATLESDQYTILEASDGQSALDLIHSERPWMVLLDVGMPGKTGLDICREVKSAPELKGTIVVMLTGFNNPADREAGLAAGADAYLAKRSEERRVGRECR